jgi:hypothetical protein
MSLYEELKGWQNGIGSLLGFLALMVAALWNFRLNRRRDAALRDEEALSVAAALYGEIILLRKEIARLSSSVAAIHLHQSSSIDRHFAKAHSLSEPMLYKALSSKIGLLSADLILAITEFHEKYQQAKSWLPLLVEDDERKYGYSPLHVLIPARDAVKEIAPALRKIERLASIDEPAAEPDLGHTEDVIEVEEELSNTSGHNC